MPNFRPEQITQWISTSWENEPPGRAITGVSIDSRTIREGDLYVALQGDRFDGHDFVEAAFSQGAAGAVVSVDYQQVGVPLLRVPDTLAGLQELARGYRQTWSSTVIGITGSVGKTTVKEMCAAVLSVKGETHRTAGNYNNHIGLPLTMLAMPRHAEYGVFEVGMNHPGEIACLSAILRPQIAVITDIGNAHREHFSSLEAIAAEKAELAWAVPEHGIVILDNGSEWFDLIGRHTCAGVRTVSMEGRADYVGRAPGPSILSVGSHTYTLPLPGEHHQRNALRAIALGLELGLTPAEIDEGLQHIKMPPMRWDDAEVNGVRFINDAYNANPLSMRANLSTFAALPDEGRKWAVVGGMHELGELEEPEHAELGRFIDQLGLDGVITVGALGRRIACATDPCFHTLSAGEAAGILKEHLQPGDRVLLKASRSEKLEQVLEHFKEI